MSKTVHELASALLDECDACGSRHTCNEVIYCPNRDAAERLEELAARVEVLEDGSMDWVSVKDGFPEQFEPVLIYTNGTAGQGRGMLVGACDNGHWFIQNSHAHLGFPNLQYEVTHWQPLPQLPKEATYGKD